MGQIRMIDKNRKKNKTILLFFMFTSMFFIIMGTIDNSNINLDEIDSISKEFGSPRLKSSGDAYVFDGMFINGTFDSGGGPGPSLFNYTYVGGDTFDEYFSPAASTWQVSNTSRIMSGGSQFGDGQHTTYRCSIRWRS
jgi:hypothetical protein